jgi:hypothetical protein
MQAVKALYKEGKIQLLTPLQGVTEAELLVIVLDKNEQTTSMVNTDYLVEPSSEQNFKSLGLSSFFETDEDHQIDWEEAFDVQAR